MQNYKLILEYDGSRYRGWQRLKGSEPTIQGKLEQVLTILFGTPIEITGSGRTDAGVHAKMQVASFHAPTVLDCEKILLYLRQYLPEDIGVISVTKAAPRFHARLNAVGKTYCYRVWNSDSPCVFDRKYVFVYPEQLDLARMRQAAELLCGTHDFRGFSIEKRTKKSTVRYLQSLEIRQVGCELRLTFSGNGFLHRMVRIMTGTLLEIGAGKREPDDIEKLLAGGSDVSPGFAAPAKGLCLMEVRY